MRHVLLLSLAANHQNFHFGNHNYHSVQLSARLGQSVSPCGEGDRNKKNRGTALRAGPAIWENLYTHTHILNLSHSLSLTGMY